MKPTRRRLEAPDALMRPFSEMTFMKALLASLALLTTFAAAAQTSPPPPGQALGSSPPGAERADERSWRGGGRSTLVVVDRDELEQRLARLESLLRNSERSGRSRLDEAYRELSDLRGVVSNAPSARGGYEAPPSRPLPPGPPAPVPTAIAEPRLRDLLTSMGRESWADDKLFILKSGMGGDFFYVEQISRVVNQFPFPKDRLSVVRLLWPRVLDRQNGHRLLSAFSFSDDKKEVQRILSSP